MKFIYFSVALLIFVCNYNTESFSFNNGRKFWAQRRLTSLNCGEAPSDSSDPSDRTAEVPMRVEQSSPRIQTIKSKILSTCAACDRGFGASSSDRNLVTTLMDQLIATNPPQNPTRGLYPLNSSFSSEIAPLQGVWRLCYTDASDVLSLAASPLTLLQGIYQVIDAQGNSVNVIDLTSRIVPLLPVPIAKSLESVLRLKVFTSAKTRSATRVGLRFMSIKVQPLSLLGQSLPSTVAFEAALPQKFLYEVLDKVAAAFGKRQDANNSAAPQSDENLNALGYFDVLYLDDDMLIIKQNQPGGVFISSRMDSELTNFY